MRKAGLIERLFKPGGDGRGVPARRGTLRLERDFGLIRRVVF